MVEDINPEKMRDLLVFYKKSFVKHWDDEKYKWQAVKHFQDNWDINAEDFGKMFETATEKTSNLLVAANFFPRGMILEFSKENPEKTRQMFEILFNENEILSKRIEKFKNIADSLQVTHNQNNSSNWKSHFQTDNAISTYLWLRFPQKYYIYKWSEYRNVAKELGYPVKFTKGSKENLENGFDLYDSICKELVRDEEIKKMLKSKLTDDCYTDDALKTLTIDFGFHISRFFQKQRSYWIVKVTNDNYWDKTINDNIWYSQQRYGYQEKSAVTNFLKQVKSVNKNDVLLLAYGNRIYAYGIVQDHNLETDQISSIDKVISEKDYEYKSGIVKFDDNEVFYENLENGEEDWGQRINVEKWLCYNPESEVNTYGVTDSIMSGIVSMSIYGISEEYGEKKMRELEKQELENQSLTEKIENLLNNTHNLILHGAPGTGKTHLAKDIASYMHYQKNYEDLTDEEKEHIKEYIGFVQFHPSYDYTDFVEGLRPVNDGTSGQIAFERKDGVFKKFCERALKNLIDSKKSAEEIEREKSVDEKIDSFLNAAIDDEKEFQTVTGNRFFVTDFNEKNIYISIPENEKVKELVLQRVELSSLLNAEDKIDNGTAVKDFFKRKWRTQQDSYVFVLYKEIFNRKNASSSAKTLERVELKPFIFIIDEINRGEMSKIFGELFFSIDPGYRGKDGLIQTQYQNLISDGDAFAGGFYVPENVYIIGTMNDIDRNVESMDFAFRRRFTFKEIKATDTQQDILAGLDDSIREDAIQRMDSLNKAIWNTENKTGIEGLSSAYHIGGAYFLKLKDLDNDFEKLWEYHLEGLLREYLRGMEDVDSKVDQLKSAYDCQKNEENS